MDSKGRRKAGQLTEKQLQFDMVILGYGFVGQAVHRLFPQAHVYDIKWEDKVVPTKHFKYAFVCVPTPPKENGECDISAVEDVLSKIDADLFIIRYYD